MGDPITVDHLTGDRFEIAVGPHKLHVDQPIDAGGTGSAPTPTELFVAGLASCVAHYARRYLARHGLPTTGLGVDATFAMAERPTRVGAVTLVMRIPAAVPEERIDALIAVASHCTVHNTLDNPPTVRIETTRGMPDSLSA